jgi:hypothetical protein
MNRVALLKDCPGELAIVRAIIDRDKPTCELPSGEVLPVLSYCGGLVRGVDYRGLRYLEQNPTKDSPSGTRASNGAIIIWVIKNGVYIGKIEQAEVFHR